MKEKLTKDAFDKQLHLIKSLVMTDAVEYELWELIESDREAIREEAREEMRKDHFKIGEEVECGKTYAYEGIVVAMASDGGSPWIVGEFVRRPQKMRPMTREELIHEIIARTDWLMRFEELSGDTLDRMAEDLGIPTEVPE